VRVDFTEIYSKVRLYLSVGRYEAAEKLLNNALDEHGSLANIHNLLGVTYHRQSKFAEAVVQFTKALKINSSFVEAGLNLAATFCDLGKYDDAKAVFTEVLASTPTNRKQPDLILGRLANQHADSGKLYEQSGLITEAMMEYKRALSLYEKMPDVRLSLGKLLFKTGQVDKALKEFQTVANQFPDEHEAQLWSGISNWKLGNVDLAHRQWQTAVSLQGGSGVSAAYLRIAQEAKKNAYKSASSIHETPK
jgi:tetratricopeptide (TPR) repeat protein